MASDERIRANRENARRSTGPRSTDGKRRASRNALRHGLAVSVLADLKLADDVSRLSEALASGGCSVLLRQLADSAAEAVIDLVRIRSCRASLIDAAKMSVFGASPPPARHGSGEGDVREEPAIDRSDLLTEPTALLSILHQVASLDRYERRAFSRRNRAFRRLISHRSG